MTCHRLNCILHNYYNTIVTINDKEVDSKSASLASNTIKMIDKLQDIFDFEIDALANVISNATSDYYVKNYAEILTKCKLPDDLDKIHRLTTSLLDWYDTNIIDFEQNEYMYNVDQHHKTIEILKQIQEFSKEETEVK